MYKIAIIDNESKIRDHLLQGINWEELGYQVAGTAGNGEEGLALIEQEKPDIVICDIIMPVMDGLAMAKEARLRNLPVKIILMSGKEEFKYAQRAISLKVEKYLLKPINTAKLVRVVQRVTRELETERKIENQIQESMPLLRSNFLSQLLTDRIPDEEEIQKQLDYLDIPLPDGRFITLIVKADDYHNPHYCKRVMGREQLKFGVYDLAMDLFSQELEIIGHDTGSDDFALIIRCADEQKGAAVHKTIYQLGDKLCRKVAAQFSSTVTIGLGRFHSGYRGIAKSYEEASSAIGYRHMVGKNRIISIQDIHLPGRRENISLAEYEKDLLGYLKLGITEEALNSLEQIKAALEKQSFVALNRVRLIGLEVSILSIKEGENWGQPGSGGRLEKLYALSSSIMNLQTIEEIFAVIRKLVEEIAKDINNQRISQQKEIIDQAVSYIETHYGSEDLSLQEVAQNVHISSSYFSTIFKKEKNINFTDYLTEVRMNKSMELLRNSNMKAYEIARTVGYSNPQYFSLCFKKYTGYSPLQFKNI